VKEAFDAALAISLPGVRERDYAVTALAGPQPLASVGRGLTDFTHRFQQDDDRGGPRVGQVKP
jgi:hypothetical protein